MSVSKHRATTPQVPVHTRVPPETKEKLRQIAKERKWSICFLAGEILKEYASQSDDSSERDQDHAA